MLSLGQALMRKADIVESRARSPEYPLEPGICSIFDFKYTDFQLADYDPHPHIAGVVAV